MLLNRINFIYDYSRIDEPLVKILDISQYSGNTFGYNIRRTEGFKRQVIPAATPLTAGTAVSAPPPIPGSVSGATPSSGNRSSDSAVSATPSEEAGPLVAGSFTVHEFDRAAIVAGFAFSTLRNTNYGTQAQNG